MTYMAWYGKRRPILIHDASSEAEAQTRAAIVWNLRRRNKIQIQKTIINDELIAERAAHTFVSVEDSVRAGNCESMTERFAHEMWAEMNAGPCAVRADILLAKRNDSFAKRAVLAAIMRNLLGG